MLQICSKTSSDEKFKHVNNVHRFKKNVDRLSYKNKYFKNNKVFKERVK